MTFLGKLLVFVNVALSVVLLTFAVALYTQRVDWSGNPNATPPTRGEVAKLKDRLKPRDGWGLYDDLSVAEGRWKGAVTSLDAAEKPRPVYRKWYEDQFKTLVDNPGTVDDVVYENGKVAIEKTGLPKLQKAADKGGQELRPLSAYKADIDAINVTIKEAQEALAKATQQDVDLTIEIALPKKGLRALIASEKAKAAQIEEEIDYVQPLWYNSLVEKELLNKRRGALEARKVELEKAKGLALK